VGYAFISYSPEQQKEADSLRLLLKNHEIDTWMAPYDVPDDCDYSDVINDAIRNSECLVLLLTEDSQNSVYVDKEIERALHYGKTIAPIQLDHAALNDSFSFYLCNQQIIMVSDIDASAPKMQSLLRHLQFLCNDRLPTETVSLDASRDRRVTRQKIARLFIWAGIILWCVSLFCGYQYVSWAQTSTFLDMYGNVPTFSEMVQAYAGYFLMSLAAIPLYLYGCGLRDPQKNTWNPLGLFSGKQILPMICAVFGSGFAMLSFFRKAVARVIRGLGYYSEPTESYILPQWVEPATWVTGLVFAATALMLLFLFYRWDKRNGFAFAKSLGDRVRAMAVRWKRRAK